MAAPAMTSKAAAAVAAAPALARPDLYSAIMDQASAEYMQIPTHRAISVEIERKIAEWRDLYANWSKQAPTAALGIGEAENSRFWTEVDNYIRYRGTRDDLKRILEVYNRVILSCTPPPINELWMTEMERMGIDIQPIRSRYKEIFETRYSVLTSQKEEIEHLYGEVVNKLLTLRGAGDPLARLCTTVQTNAGIGTKLYTAASATLNMISSRTLTFSAAVAQRIEATKNKQV